MAAASGIPHENYEKKVVNWMPKPLGVGSFGNIPPGLEYLVPLSEIWIIQEKEWMEYVKNYVPKSFFLIRNSEEQTIFIVEEKSNDSERFWWDSDRGFLLTCSNQAQQEVMFFHRPFKMKAALFSWLNLSSTGWHIEVEAPKGVPIGVVQQATSGFHRKFNLLDANGGKIAQIKGPLFEGQLWTEDVDFDIFDRSNKKTKIGTITRKYAGFMKEVMTDAQHYKITIPEGLDIRMKVLLLAGTFLIEYMIYCGGKSK